MATLCIHSICAQQPQQPTECVDESASLEQKKSSGPLLKAWLRALPRKPIVLANLSLYKLLDLIRFNIDHVLHDDVGNINTDGKKGKELFTALGVADEALRLMGAIVDDLNAGSFSYNPEIEYQFLKVCNFLKDVDLTEIEPSHIRALKDHVKKLNHYVTLYCLSRKEFLRKEDLELFNKMSKFNQILTLCLLNEDYLDIDFIDKALDVMIYRPLEVMSDHPYITMLTIAVIAAAAVGYFYVYPRWFGSQNLNKDYDVTQLEGALQNDGSSCGYFAIVHEVINKNAKNEQDAQRMLELFKANPETILQPLKQFIEEKRQRAIDTQKRNGNSATNKMLPGKGLIDDDEITLILNNQQLMNHISQTFNCGALKVDNVAVVSRFDSNVLLTDPTYQAFEDSVNKLKQSNIPQHIVLNTGGHWVGVSIYPDNTKKHGIRIDVVNSMPWNITDAAPVNDLLRYYARN